MEAMRDEMDSMVRNKIWKLVDLPPGCKSIGNKRVFKIKRQTDGLINKFKAHLMQRDLPRLRV